MGYRWARRGALVSWFVVSGLASAAVVYPPPVTPQQVAAELRAVATLMDTAAPQGFLSVFGGARVRRDDPQYELVRRFASLWVAAEPGIPVATGGGPGNMESANRGALEAGGVSIGFVMAGMPGETANEYLTHELVFRSFAYRESELIDRARALVFTLGGVGTRWELFEALAKIHTGQIAARNVILLGPPEDWEPTLALIRSLVDNGRVAAAMLGHLHFAVSEEEAVGLARQHAAESRSRIPSVGNVEVDTERIRAVIARAAPRGFVAIFGGARVTAQDPSYPAARALGRALAERGIAVATGGGPGIMEAANLGAREGGGVSLGFAMGGLPGQAANPHITDGYVATAFAQREAEMIDGAYAIVLADGGLGTQWELFEALSKILTEQIAPKPIVLWGPRAQWQPVLDLLEAMAAKAVLPRSLLQWVHWTDDIDEVLRQIPAPPAADCAVALAG